MYEWPSSDAGDLTAHMFTDSIPLGLLFYNEKEDSEPRHSKSVCKYTYKHTCTCRKCPVDNVTHLVAAAAFALSCVCVCV